MSSFDIWFCNFIAMINSLTFLVMVRSGVKKAVFAYCWVMVEPPWAFSDPDFKLLKNARAIPTGLTAL